MRTIDKIITEVDGKYGAPMGRYSDPGQPPKDKKVYDCAVPMNGDYDRGGTYWGSGPPQLRVRYTKDLSFIQFYRVGNED